MLVAAFRGWNDGGQGASLAARLSREAVGRRRGSPRSTPEKFYDFQATRPHVSLEDGMTRKLDWPENGFFHAEIPGTDRDAVHPARHRAEPPLEDVLASSCSGSRSDLGVERVVTFGSLLADVPHTRPAPVTAAATDEALMEELGLEPSRYEGPTGIVGVLLDACRRRGHLVAQPLGGGAALRLARAEPARGALARAGASAS